MKTTILKLIFSAALIVVAGITLYRAQEKEMLSDITLSNVEALARGEGDGDCSDCAIYAPGICKDWGWGGCTGKNAIKYL